MVVGVDMASHVCERAFMEWGSAIRALMIIYMRWSDQYAWEAISIYTGNK